MFSQISSWVGNLPPLILVTLLTVSLIKLISFVTEFKRIANSVADVSQFKRHWLLGHLPIIQPDEESLRFVCNTMNKFPKCVQIWFGPFILYFSGYHPDILKPLLLSDEPKDDIAYRFLRPWIGDGLLTSSGKKWKRNRQMLTRAFHFDILKHYLVVFNDTTGEMVNKWLEQDKKVISVEMFNDVSLMALDSILQCIMTTKSHCQRVGSKNEYLNSVRIITEIARKRLFNPLMHIDFIFDLSPSGKEFRKALDISHEYTENVIKKRRLELEKESRELEKYISSHSGNEVSDSPSSKLDFLDILFLSKDDQGNGLSHQEICDEVNTFVFEGHDTVTSGLSWAFYNLSVYPEYQERCRKEVREVLGGRERIEWEDLSKFMYITKFIKESLRMHSPVFSMARKLSKPLFYSRGFGSDQFNTDPDVPPGVDASRTLPKGINASTMIIQLHRNPFVWEDPDKFDPERFNPDNIEKRSPFAFIPFSSGPRNCIGQHFAMNEMKVVIARALTHFRFSVDESFPAPELELYTILRSTTGIHLKLERI